MSRSSQHWDYKWAPLYPALHEFCNQTQNFQALCWVSSASISWGFEMLLIHKETDMELDICERQNLELLAGFYKLRRCCCHILGGSSKVPWICEIQLHIHQTEGHRAGPVTGDCEVKVSWGSLGILVLFRTVGFWILFLASANKYQKNTPWGTLSPETTHMRGVMGKPWEMIERSQLLTNAALVLCNA